MQHLSIDSLIDGGQEFRIYNDGLCNKFALKTYPNNTTLSDFNVENLNIQTFCSSFIFRP